MGKGTSTRWFIGAWLVWLIAAILAAVMRSGAGGAVTPGLYFLGLVIVAAVVVMLVTWIGALVKLGAQGAWGWFVAMLILGVVGLGIVSMLAYAIAGPEDVSDVAIRPTTT